jgi:transcriptional regulator with XRE-family HTH domain
MNVQMIRKELPTGAISEIAQRTGISTATVSLVFRGLSKTPKRATIIKAAAEYITECKAKEAEAMRAITEALNPEPANTL